MARDMAAFEVEVEVDGGGPVLAGRPRKTYVQEYAQTSRCLQGDRMGRSLFLQLPVGTDDRGSGIAGAVFNLANTILGSAITGLPFVMKSSGVVPFVVFLTISAGMSYQSVCYLVLACSYIEGKKDFQALGEKAFGAIGVKITAATACILCSGALISYLVLVGLQAPALCKLAGFTLPAWMTQVFLAIFIIYPLCMLKDISLLSPTSAFATAVFGLISATSIAFLISNDDFYNSPEAVRLGVERDDAGIAWLPPELGLKAVREFPTILFAFGCEFAFLPIAASLRSPHAAAMQKVGWGGLLAAWSIYVSLGLSAYFTYQGHTQNMILLNFRHCTGMKCACASGENCLSVDECPKLELEYDCRDDNSFVTVLNGLFLFAVLMGYPCVHFALRTAQISLAVGMDADFSWRVHGGLATINVLVSLAVALAVGSNVSLVFRWTGAIGCPMISYVLPSLFYFKIVRDSGGPFTTPYYRSIGSFLYGIGVICFGLACNVMVQDD